MKTLPTLALLLLLQFFAIVPCQAMISLLDVGPKKARELGITMKQRPNGDAGTMVWIEFRKEGVLNAFTYCELRVVGEDGKHRLSARLEPHPVTYGQSGDLITIAFSGAQDELKNCVFRVVAYGSSMGDVGLDLPVRKFFEPQPASAAAP